MATRSRKPKYQGKAEASVPKATSKVTKVKTAEPKAKKLLESLKAQKRTNPAIESSRPKTPEPENDGNDFQMEIEEGQKYVTKEFIGYGGKTYKFATNKDGAIIMDTIKIENIDFEASVPENTNERNMVKIAALSKAVDCLEYGDRAPGDIWVKDGESMGALAIYQIDQCDSNIRTLNSAFGQVLRKSEEGRKSFTVSLLCHPNGYQNYQKVKTRAAQHLIESTEDTGLMAAALQNCVDMADGYVVFEPKADPTVVIDDEKIMAPEESVGSVLVSGEGEVSYKKYIFAEKPLKEATFETKEKPDLVSEQLITQKFVITSETVEYVQAQYLNFIRESEKNRERSDQERAAIGAANHMPKLLSEVNSDAQRRLNPRKSRANAGMSIYTLGLESTQNNRISQTGNAALKNSAISTVMSAFQDLNDIRKMTNVNAIENKLESLRQKIKGVVLSQTAPAGIRDNALKTLSDIYGGLTKGKTTPTMQQLNQLEEAMWSLHRWALSRGLVAPDCVVPPPQYLSLLHHFNNLFEDTKITMITRIARFINTVTKKSMHSASKVLYSYLCNEEEAYMALQVAENATTASGDPIAHCFKGGNKSVDFDFPKQIPLAPMEVTGLFQGPVKTRRVLSVEDKAPVIEKVFSTKLTDNKVLADILLPAAINGRGAQNIVNGLYYLKDSVYKQTTEGLEKEQEEMKPNQVVNTVWYSVETGEILKDETGSAKLRNHLSVGPAKDVSYIYDPKTVATFEKFLGTSLGDLDVIKEIEAQKKREKYVYKEDDFQELPKYRNPFRRLQTSKAQTPLSKELEKHMQLLAIAEAEASGTSAQTPPPGPGRYVPTFGPRTDGQGTRPEHMEQQ